MQRSRWALFFVAVATTAAVVTFGAGSGTAQLESNTFTGKKVVDGSAPPGTEVKVGGGCDDDITEMTFDEHGSPQPSGSNVVEVNAGTTCTATETADGGATSVTYECD